MEIITNPSIASSSRCVITTGVASSRYLINHMPDLLDHGTHTCNCSGSEDLSGIRSAGCYYVVIDFSDELYEEVISGLFNRLIPLDVPVHVIVAPNHKPVSHDIERFTSFLEKLGKHGFITLDMKKDASSMELAPEKNVVFFAGPGNTGKTSVIASLCSVFRENGQRTALIDITRSNKLINYFPGHKLLSFSNIKELSCDKDFCKSVNMYSDGLTDLFVYDYESNGKQPSVIYFCELIRRFTGVYDYVLINTDDWAVENTPNIFKIAGKIFIVHDFLPTKINRTKKMLMGLMKAGVDTQQFVSLIYNKTLKNSVDLGKIEEKLLLVKLPSKKIIPVVDINCNTFEIPFDKKTMEALVRNLALKQTGIEDTSIRYRYCIGNIYKYINDIEYTENDEREIAELVKSGLHSILHNKKLNKLGSTITAGINQLKNNETQKAIAEKTVHYLKAVHKNSTEFINKQTSQFSGLTSKLREPSPDLKTTQEE